jgi:SAM-dependent methyltransferase
VSRISTPASRKANERPRHTLGLEVMTDAVRYRRYLVELLRPHLGRAILEVGSGLGDLAADLRGYDRLGGRPEVEVRRLDLRGGAPSLAVDTVLAVNVLEHLVDDIGALRRMSDAAKRGGNVVLFVPGYPSLYGPHDRAAGHVRRYVPGTLRAAVVGAGLQVEVLRPVNFIGGIAWWIAVRVGGCSSPNRSLVRLYDRIVVPIVRVLEARWRPPFGQSLLCVARVPDGVDTGVGGPSDG